MNKSAFSPTPLTHDELLSLAPTPQCLAAWLGTGLGNRALCEWMNHVIGNNLVASEEYSQQSLEELEENLSGVRSYNYDVALNTFIECMNRLANEPLILVI